MGKNKEDTHYEVVVIGGGVTGTAILYTLAKYTNVKSIALLERYKTLAAVQSAKDNNSQTLHFGDIETNYTLEKAGYVKEGAEMVRRYVEEHSEKKLFRKFHKMVLAVGNEEVAALRERHKAFKKLFPQLKLLEREQIQQKEPKLVKARGNVPICAMYSEEGYAVDFGALAKSFGKEATANDKDISIRCSTRVTAIQRTKRGYMIVTDTNVFHAKTVIVAASANSLTFAHKLGYRKDLILLPVAGDFFRSRKLLNGKVYMMQHPKLPFAAIHGDPDVGNPEEVRFGPIAKVIPLLEKGNYRSFIDFMRLFNFKFSHIVCLLRIISDPIYYRYVFWNVLYEMPFFGKYIFAREVRKIIPSIRGSDLQHGRKLGGIRPQVVDTTTGKMALGEASIVGKDILFNITPSPGASVCLQNAEKNVKQLIEFLGKGYTFDQKGFDAHFRK